LARATTRQPRQSAYDKWAEAQDIPIHRGYFCEDLRTIEVGYWKDREYSAAILMLAGQENVSEARVTEIPPGETLPPMRIALEEQVYILAGNGICTVWADDSTPKRTFEWHARSIFLIPPNYHYQLANARGDQPARVLQYNFLPLSMVINPNPAFHFNNEFVDKDLLYSDDNSKIYSEAKKYFTETVGDVHHDNLWRGNFFPDMANFDKLEPHRERGAGGDAFYYRSPTGGGGHMSVFPVGTYKKAHRHGPATVIVIPRGEGFTVLWEEGKEKIFVPWHEGSCFVPPREWYHQHFNVGAEPARYFAMARPSDVFDRDEDDKKEIPYSSEDPKIRAHFEAELAKRWVESLMPDECYTNPKYRWAYKGD
jgi:mannose-6-phosphate isomerase-like protein (cupin superfamily)